MTAETAKRISGFLGLCNRAGQLVFGQEACVNAVRKRDAGIVLLDESCSENTRKRFLDTCGTHEIPLYGVAEGMIDSATGKSGRKVAAVKAGGMAEKMLTLLKDESALCGDAILHQEV